MENEPGYPEPSYDWEGMRRWCVSYLRLFLQFAARSASGEAYEEHNRGLLAIPLSWKRLQSISDGRIRDIVETITAVVSEAVATRSVLPGNFSAALSAAKSWLRVLGQPSDIGEAAREVAKIEGRT